jgi:imidazolonepropionase-like amidohydrolase
MNRHVLLALATASLVAGCAGPAAQTTPKPSTDDALSLDIQDEWHDPVAGFPDRPPEAADRRAALRNPAAPTIVIRGGTVLTATGARYEEGVVVLEGGAIRAVGDAADIPDGAMVIEAAGKFVTPGIIDTHSHIGVYAAPGVIAHRDGNEMTSPNTADVRAEYGYWPQDPTIPRAIAGGVTTALILPGSANLFGGRGFTVVMRPGRTVDDVRFPGAPPTLKMACGENPKRVYGEKGGPATRMGVYTAFRNAFQAAAEYEVRREGYRRSRALWERKRARAAELEAEAAAAGKEGRVKVEAAPDRPARDAKLETLAAVLRGEILVQIHCYRADEIRAMVAIADEFSFPVRSFHHALEAYKVRDLLAARGIAINTWADWWGFKLEALDGIPQNAALFAESGGRAVIHSDSAIGIQRLNQEAAKAMWAGRHAGVEIDEDQALRWVTANSAWVLGIDDVTGTLEAGKRADVVVWSAHPFSVYARADVVVQGGEVVYDRERGREPTDFELGNSVAAMIGGER